MKCLDDFSPDVQVVSVDEAFIDLTGTRKLFNRNYINIAKLIRETILEKTDIPVSIGISLSKTLAKLASDKAKSTGGIYAIGTSKIISELQKTNIDEISGIGKANSLTLRRYGILTGYEFVSKTDEWIKTKLGIDFKFHHLRHTYGTRLAELNTPTHILCNQMGHASGKVTERYYLAVSKSGIDILVRNLNAI